MYDPEIEEWKTPPFLVGVPFNPVTLWRLVTSADPTEDGFRPDCETRKRFPTEDNCSFLGFSAWRLPGQARESAEHLNPMRLERGDPPFTHMAEIKLWPKKRHTCARVGFEAGHWVVWAPADHFMKESRRGETLPI
jgi:hypothetical protein